MDEEKNEESQENPLVKVRYDKLKQLQEMGIDPYPNRYEVKDKIRAVIEKHSALQPEEKTEDFVKIAGRMMARREMGKASFGNVKDFTGSLQFYIREDDVGKDAYNLFKILDIGDIIGLEGFVFKTKKGELSVHVQKIELLSKSLYPLPEKWHGLKDDEARYRQRYVDMIMNDEVKHTFLMRTRIVNEIRSFLVGKGFVEVETPILQPIYGGAAAKPFTTVHNELKMKMFLRISNELYLKRLIVGGFEKVFEFSRDFRNEGIDARHNPEFTVMETMCAYADYNDSMKLTEELLSHVAKHLLGKTEVDYQEQLINLHPPFQRITMLEAVKKYTDVDFSTIKTVDEARDAANELGVRVEGDTVGKILSEVYEELVEPHIVQPTFVMDYPIEVSPLAKRKKNAADYTERFELIIGGREYANVYSELNEPIVLRKNWEEQRRLMEKGDQEAQPMDEDFIRALEVGMPPTSGIGIGIDRFVMLLTNSASIRDVIMFPTLKKKE